MDKELNIDEFAEKQQDDFFEDLVFYAEEPGKMVDLATVIWEKLANYHIDISKETLLDNAEGWKTIAMALCSSLLLDYGIDKSDIVELTKENNKINYANLINAINPADSKDVVNKIKGFLTHRELAPEQILYGLGLILDKSKETYITMLKQDLVEMKHQLKEVVNENNKFRERLNKAEARKAQYPLKKRVIVIKSKKEGE